MVWLEWNERGKSAGTEAGEGSGPVPVVGQGRQLHGVGNL